MEVKLQAGETQARADGEALGANRTMGWHRTVSRGEETLLSRETGEHKGRNERIQKES